MKKTNSLVWAFNPYETNEDLDDKASFFLNQLNQEMSLKIQPVYVVSSDFFISGNYFESLDVDLLRSKVEKDCQDYLKKLSIDNLEAPLLLDNHSISRNGEVHPLVKYIETSKVDFAFLSSSGRKGWSRAFLGSFAESFLLKTKIPVFVIGPQNKKKKSLKKGLMPVELTESSQRFVESFLDRHELSFLDKLTLFHKISLIDIEDVAWTRTLYKLEKCEVKDIVDEAYFNTKKYLELFKSHPLSEKRITYDISQSIKEVPEVILERVEKLDMDLIIIRSVSGFVSANLMGSVTRDIIRDASVPVLVYPYQYNVV